ncbi:MAG: DUF1987 domain-containing protein [Bacteroidales bacterium]|nr:DUF1987 domain-containing protein [Bacteroidales bacterium]
METNSNTLENNSLEVLRIEPTFATPAVVMDADNGIFRISGNSYPEDPLPVYVPVIDWFKKYMEHPLPRTVFEFKFMYFSTASTQLIFELFRMLEEIFNNKYEVLVRWYYTADNDEIHENGIDFSSLFEMPFEVIELPNENPEEE